MLEVRRQRPVRQAEAAAHEVKPEIDGDRGGVGIVPQEREPLGILEHTVEAVAVQHEEAPAVGHGVNGLVQHRNPAEAMIGEVAEVFIMVAGDVDHPGSLARLAQYLLHNVVVRLTPVPRALHAPAIDDVADQIQILAFRVLQKVEQHLRLTAARAKMNVGNPDAAVLVPSS